MNGVAAITCFFNFDGDKGRVQNFIEFKDSIEQQEIPLFVIEVISEGHNSILRPVLDKDKHFIEKVFLPILIKGNALNYLSSKVSNEYKYLASINSDKIILNNNWAKEAADLLKKYKLVKIGDSRIGGFPIIADRDFFDTVGLFDHDFCGNGDIITFFGATGKTNFQCEPAVDLLGLYEKNNLNIFYKILSYKLDCHNFCKNNISTIQSDFKNITERDLPSAEEMINLTKEINVERNISYKDLHSLISVKNIKEFNYPSKLLEILKRV